eukprot:179762-Ditylum_brightwellii.AAC.1
MSEDDINEDIDYDNVLELQAHTSNDEEEGDSSDDDNSSYKPEEEDDESITDMDADTAEVYEDTTAGLTSQTEEEQSNGEHDINEHDEEDDEQIEAYSTEANITGFTMP